MEFLGRQYVYSAEIDYIDGSSTITARDLSVIKTSTGNHRWVISMGLMPLNGASEAVAELSQHRFRFSNRNLHFEIPMPQLTGYEPTGDLATMTLHSGITAGASSFIAINNDSFTNCPNGQFIKFANHTKIYQITQINRTTRTIQLFPNLISDVSSSDRVSLLPNILVKYDQSALTSTSFDVVGTTFPRLEVREYVR